MDISWLTLRDLQYLVSVAQTLHFGKAAQNCHVSQPALSVQIRKMEEQLGAVLFERSNRSVVVTELGQAVVQQARLVLDEATKIQTIAQGALGPLQGTLRLGAIATLGPYLIPHILGPLKKKFPAAKLLIREGLTENLLEQLRAGTLDAVLLSPPFESEGLESFGLFNEPFVLGAPKGHELLKKETLRAGDIRASEMVLLEDGHCLKDQALELCTLNRRGNIQEFQATSLETLKYMVAEGLGYTLVPALAATLDPKLDRLIQYREFNGKEIGRKISLVCRARFSGLKDVKALAEFIRQNVPASCQRVAS